MASGRPDVRLGALETLVATLVPAVLARLAERRPELRTGIHPSTDRLALLPEFAVTDAVRTGTLAVLGLPLPSLTLRLVWQSAREQDPRVRDLLYAASA
ncbi:hypothetical protein [Actinoplanes sp. NPDC051851]|uniref:hypothetical protein n=1 Tax=Actinoplanes sp. NPDC051851 TaxID=3154753 RepID=UPI00343DD94A